MDMDLAASKDSNLSAMLDPGGYLTGPEMQGNTLQEAWDLTD